MCQGHWIVIGIVSLIILSYLFRSTDPPPEQIYSNVDYDQILEKLNYPSNRYLKQFYNGMRWTIEDQFYSARQVRTYQKHPDQVAYRRIFQISSEQTEFKSIAKGVTLRLISGNQEQLKKDPQWLKPDMQILQRRLNGTKFSSKMMHYGHRIGLETMKWLKDGKISVIKTSQNITASTKIGRLGSGALRFFEIDRDYEKFQSQINKENAITYTIVGVFVIAFIFIYNSMSRTQKAQFVIDGCHDAVKKIFE